MLGHLILDALLSLGRMAATYVVSVAFALYCGFAMARSRRVRAVLMPVLDILQSLPLVAFVPAAVGVILAAGQGGRLALEAAVVFLLWSCMAWNLVFGVYETLVTLPSSVTEGVASTGCAGWLRLKRLELPACVPTLLANSMMSWAGGWYFLIGCEIITVGNREIRVRGLGSFMAEAMLEKDVGGMLAGIAVLISLILLMDFFLWTPLSVWADRFRQDTETPAPTPQSLALNLWRRARLPRRIALRLVRRERAVGRRLAQAGRWLSARSPVRARHVEGVLPVLNAAAAAILVLALAMAAGWVIRALAKPWPAEAARIPLALGASFLRLLAAYLLCLAWTVPVAIWVGGSQRAARLIMPAAQILAAVPASAFFPFLALGVVFVFHSVTLAAILLAATGMQWYLFFNLASGAHAVPGDLREAVRAQGLSRKEVLKKLMLPAMLPSLITGSLAGWGGAWNALILTEYFRFGSLDYEVQGIGALLVRASRDGNQPLLILGLAALTLLIILINRFVWQRAYAHASERYSLER